VCAGQVILEFCEKHVDGLGTFDCYHLGTDFPLEFKLNALVDVTEGLDDQGTIHGDIKPINILVSGKEILQIILGPNDII